MEHQADKDKSWELLDKVLMTSLEEQRRARRWSTLFKILTFIYVAVIVILAYPRDGVLSPAMRKEHTALVEIKGPIMDGEQANASTIVTGLRAAFKEKHARAVLMSINSPGGTPVQAGYVYDEILRLKGLYPGKKLYAVIGDVGASGAYYVAAAADEIYADKASLVGSIGVISASFGFVGTMELLGVERRVFTAGSNKNMLDPFSPVTDSQRGSWQEILNITHEQFIHRVKQGRGERLKDSPDLFSGLVWTGEQALGMGLVDGLGSPGYVAREIIGAEEFVDYTPMPKPLDQFIKQLGLAIGDGVATYLQTAAQLPGLR